MTIDTRYFKYEFTMYAGAGKMKKADVIIEAPNSFAGRQVAREKLAEVKGKVLARTADITNWGVTNESTPLVLDRVSI